MVYEKKILVCDNSIEGIFTAVYDGWHWENKGISVIAQWKERSNSLLRIGWILRLAAKKAVKGSRT